MTDQDLKPPSRSDIRDGASAHYISLSDKEVDELVSFLPKMCSLYERIDEIEGSDASDGPTRRSREPSENADPLNAFARRCDVSGTGEGPLAGCRIGIKDNIAVAGIEMGVGSAVMDGYVPKRDATVVRKVLDAGGRIRGKLTLDALAVAASGELSADGPVRNPRSPDHLAGGSTSGAPPALLTDEIDIAIGTDTGGSLRIPAAWSGCVGLKPTYGLVPYTGTVGLAYSMDHVGPMARTVSDCARGLAAIAGYDREDGRQRNPDADFDVPTPSEFDPSDVTVGVLEEGFGHPRGEETVDARVREAIADLKNKGFSFRKVSIPLHGDAVAIWTAIANGELRSLLCDEGVHRSGGGRYDDRLATAFARRRRERADQFQPLIKLTLILAEYLGDRYESRHYNKARRLRRSLIEAYDEALKGIDALALPTTPITAHRVANGLTGIEKVVRAVNMVANTCPFDVSGHPALSLPCGTANGLPVGLTLVGERFDDATVLRAGRTIESALTVDLPEPRTN